MHPRLRPLVLCCLALPAWADLQITTRRVSSHWTITETRYVKGRNWREESHHVLREGPPGARPGPDRVVIHNADRGFTYILAPETREYTAHKIPRPPGMRRAKATVPVNDSGRTLIIYRDTVDTGERKMLFRRLARHVIQTDRRAMEPAEPAYANNSGTITDGWYIDLPEAFPERTAGVVYEAVFLPCPSQDCKGPIRIEERRTGPRENGFPVVVETKSGYMQEKMEVLELIGAPLDMKLFEPPANFNLALSLPGESRPGFLQTLAMSWQYLMNSVQALLN